MASPNRFALLFLAGAFCYTIIGQFWPVSDSYQRLPRLRAEPAAASADSGFAPNAVYPSTPPRAFGFETYGSWLGADTTTGTTTTAWYKPEQKFAIFVAGYPVTAGNSLAVELEFKNGERKQVPLDVADAGDVLSRRAVLAGLVLGFAYLVHPLSLLSVPPFALLILIIHMKPIAWRTQGEKTRPWQFITAATPGMLRALVGCTVCAVFFFAWNGLSTGPSQATFISYVISANGVCFSINR